MSYTVFARKYRPQTFADVIGQEHITRTLQNAIEQNRLAHAYIFVGPRGTGKTSTARILAMALNCTNGPRVDFDPNEPACREIAEGRSMNVLEFDAASNTQVDKIREIIIDNVKYAPSGDAKFKVYIVDEVHMLSTSSFNALLKTLEEPPSHVKFVFATTDVQKVPTTILSRCQRFDLKRIPTALIRDHLLMIAGKEGVRLSSEAAETIARGAEGGMRDAESMLDQLVAFCGAQIEDEDVLKVFGFTAQETVTALCEQMIKGDASAALRLVHEQAEAGKDLSRLLADVIAHLRNLLIAKADPAGLDQEFSEALIASLGAQAAQLSLDRLLDLIDQFGSAEGRMKWAPNKKMHLEIAVIRAIQTLGQATLTEVIDTLGALRSGTAPAPAAAAQVIAPKPVKSVAPRAAAAVAKKPEKAAETSHVAEPAPAPESTEPAPLPPVESAAASASTPEEIWAAALKTIRDERHPLRLWASSGALLRIEDGVAVLGFSTEQTLAVNHCEEPLNRKYLEGLLSGIAGQPLKLKCELQDGLKVQHLPPARAEEKKPEAAPDAMQDFQNDPLIRKALELFKAEIQPA